MARISANNTKMYLGDKLLDLLMEVPELGGTPEKIEVTTLADPIKRFVSGIKDMGELAFKFLYSDENDSAYNELRDLEGKIADDEKEYGEFRIVYPDDSVHSFKAKVGLKMDAASVNAPLTFTCTMTMESDIAIGDYVFNRENGTFTPAA